ncbi:P-loop containing nucleoside triphosphate hydrolase protein [Dimargaris cristalligena]|uniref:P-loop containing nucleoside triphosphate hydrolase protein n=1 Tax=Dimargaris cristalligena TaxID=215637 RepID=A0A4P9ZTY5_9FUNG|nr:P-loop containing nucleoside triphosphate hydrolase protein [Dimargaris cristalligena]|eukprot:RKP36977.1 P-loop containing nucleoside triphosphate hydrolase protein [Dimargaris cristalligena]
MAFEDVHWTRQGVPILRGLSFTIPANQVTAIVGLTGSGKSTIAKLLLRLEGVTTGRVTLNGHDLCNVTHNALRSNVNYVEQTPQFFESKSVAHNLGYATASTGKLAGQELVEEAAKLGHIYDAIKEKPEGRYWLVFGLRSTFSGGEQHRIAISRALLKPKPLLVLDEATSALDSATEERVMESIRKHCGTVTTTVIIAHRLSTVKQADQIVVIDKGQVAQVGTHTTLYADKEGIYSRLWAASGVTDGSGT